MVQSVLSEISKLRLGAPITIDYHNSNRYRLVAQENNGSKTAYCFSTPIYNRKTRKLVDMKFRSNGETIYATGSNTNITLSHGLLMENAEGAFMMELPQKPILFSLQEIRSGAYVLSPTTNGVTVKCDVSNNSSNNLIIEVGQPYLNIRANDRCVAFMKEEFRPLVVLSCVGSLDASGNVIAPAKVEYQKLTDKKYWISVSATSPLAQSVLFEVNMYENKLFQDTTVESMNPSVNNAFGGIGFIGNSSVYGEQWLYLCKRKLPQVHLRLKFPPHTVPTDADGFNYNPKWLLDCLKQTSGPLTLSLDPRGFMLIEANQSQYCISPRHPVQIRVPRPKTEKKTKSKATSKTQAAGPAAA